MVGYGLAPARAQTQENPGFPDSAQAEFHNAALVYAESSLNAEPVRPLFSRQDATGKATPRASPSSTLRSGPSTTKNDLLFPPGPLSLSAVNS